MSPAHRLVPLIALLALVACAWLAPLDEAATPVIESGLKRALASFAAARALNAAISVAQGTEVAVAPGGLGMTLTPGQALDPVNDLVEQFATLMLSASVAFGVQRTLVAIGGVWVMSLLLTGAAIAWASWHVRGEPAPGWLTRILVALILVRFAVPIATLGSDFAFQRFLADDYEAAQAGIEESAGALPMVAGREPEAPADETLVDRLKRWSRGASVGESIDKLKQSVENTVERIVRVIVVFVLQTLLVPLLLLWLLIRAGRMMVAGADGRRRAGRRRLRLPTGDAPHQ